MPLPRQRGLTEQAANAAIDTACRMLVLPSIRHESPDIAERAVKDQMTHRGFFAELLMAECDDRARRRSERRIKADGFPREKSLRTLGFDAHPNIDPATVHTLASCEWMKKSQPLCLIGDSGAGKSHTLIALGTGAAMKGYRVRYTLATKLVNELVEAADEKQLNKTIARYGRVAPEAPAGRAADGSSSARAALRPSSATASAVRAPARRAVASPATRCSCGMCRASSTTSIRARVPSRSPWNLRA